MNKKDQEKKIAELESLVSRLKAEKTDRYKNWENDLGFLNFILSRKKSIVEEFLVATYSKQLQNNDYLKDEDIEPIVENIVIDTAETLGAQYKEFLIEKYFGSEKKLLEFISEDAYISLINDAIKRNNKKINLNIYKESVERAIENISSRNLK